MKFYIILLSFFLVQVTSSFAQDDNFVSASLEQELINWEKKWTFDSYIKNSVVVISSENVQAKKCILLNDGVLAGEGTYQGVYSTGYFFVNRFGKSVKSTFESFVFYKGNQKVVRICYKDNMESRCNHSALTE